MATKRILQVAEQIREHIALMLARHEISDPQIRGVTLSAVKLSPDLQLAKVYFFTQADQKLVLAGLKRAAGYIRRDLGKILKVRHIPALAFYYDDTAEYSVSIHTLLSKVREQSPQNVTPEKPADALLPLRSASSCTQAHIASALTYGASPEQVFEVLQENMPENDES